MPPGWSVVDAAAGEVTWAGVDDCGEGVNFTGGAGGAACASSDRAGAGAFDVELRSPLFDLSAAAAPVLRFRANYQSFAAADRLEVGISLDGGATWGTLFAAGEDLGVFRRATGEEIEVDLAPYAGLAGLMLRWRYVDPDPAAFDWYAQIDDAAVVCDPRRCDLSPITGVVVDGGFESAASWAASSSRFATPLCTASSCGVDGARSGDGWAFFGGVADDAETASIEQDVVIEEGFARLSFFLWIPAASGSGADVLRLVVDGGEALAVGEGDRRYRGGYRRVDVDLTPWADGGSHRLRFEAATAPAGAGGHTSFWVDDVALEICTAVVADPDVMIGNVRLEEGNVGLTEAVFTISLSAPSQHAITVDYATRDVTATVADDDYRPTAGTLTLPPFARSAIVAVPVVGDTIDEPEETFELVLSNPSRGVLVDAEGGAAIYNDDFAFLTVGDAAALERDDGATQAVFTVILSSPSSQTVIVDYATSDGTAVAGADYMAAASSLSFPPGTVTRQIVVAVAGDRRAERDETFFVDLRNPTNAAIDRDRGVGTIHDDDRGRFPVVGSDVLYTESVDFDQGRLLNVTHDVPDQLRLTRRKATFPNVWIAASKRGTLVRVDTRTGTILGEYATGPDAVPDPNPSRTTVALDGSVWAGNRGDGSVIHVGLVEDGQCVDRDGNGVIDTSSGYGDVRAWPGDGVEGAADECVLHYVQVSASGTRHLSIDAGNDVWVSGVGGVNDRVFELVDGDSGAILRTEGPFPCGGYGGLVDRAGVVWSAEINGPVLRFDPATGEARCVGDEVESYGLALDGDGNVWVAAPGKDRVWRISGDGHSVAGPFAHGSPAAQGLAVDDAGSVWVSSAKWGNAATIGHLRTDGTFVGNVVGVPPGSSGVAVDAAGKVWTANATASSLSRIDPRLGPIGADGVTRIGQVDLTVPVPGAEPYNYSDMTGLLALANTAPQGSWQVIQDAGAAGATWGVITWNVEAEGVVPAGAGLTVEARAADAETTLGGASFLEVANGAPFALAGRFIQVRVTLRAGPDDVGPVLSDLRVALADPDPAVPAVTAANAEAFESDSGSVPVSFVVSLSAPSDGGVEVGYATVEASATAGTDFTPVSGVLVFPAGSTRETVTVDVLGDEIEEDDEFFFLRLEAPRGAVLADALGVARVVDDDFRVGPVAGETVRYTRDEDFDRGRLFNLHHDAPLGDQLQVTEEVGPFPFIWIAASGRGTIVKIDTRTGAILGEYSTNPDNRGNSNPSRTTVALDGSVWAGNREDGSVIHVGLVEEGQCVDRNGNGVIETSTGYGDLLPWPNASGVDTDGGVETARDECVLHYVKVSAAGPRHLSIDPDGNLWVSGFFGAGQRVFDLLDGRTGEVLRTEGPLPCGGYGGLMDKDGIIWSQEWRGAVLRWDPRIDPPTAESLRCVGRISGYGIALGPTGDIFVTRESVRMMWKIDGETLEVTQLPSRSSWCAQGLAVDENEHVWVSSSRWCSGQVINHFGPDGTFLGTIPAPAGSTGVAVDGSGKIWAASDQANQVFRIDPRAGPLGADGVTPLGEVDLVVNIPGAQPYNYSDMTGLLAIRRTSPRGTWTVIQDGGRPATRWGRVSWNAEAQGTVPAGASITMEARAADTVAGLGGLSFLRLENGVPFALDGRFLEVRATLRPNLDGESPVLSDVEIRTGDLGLPALAVDDVTVTEGDAGTVGAAFALRLSSPAADEVLVDYDVVDATAEAGADYLAASGRVAFAPGETAKEVRVEILADVFDEADETFLVELSLPRGAVLADPRGTGTILDDDPSVELDVADVAVDEGDPPPEGGGSVDAVFVLELSAPSPRRVRIDYVTRGGTATAGVDYVRRSGYLEFPPGVVRREVVVEILGDLDLEDDETFRLELANPDGADPVRLAAEGVIRDDDLSELLIDDVTVDEGDAGTVEAAFTVVVSPRPGRRDVTVDFATVAGTAVAGDDFRPAAGTLIIPAGEPFGTIVVPVVGDLFLEDDETFVVELSNAAGAELADAVGEGTIRDDEPCPGPNLLANPGAEARPIDGALPAWTALAGTAWQRRLAPPEPFAGRATFFPGDQAFAELWQDVDVGVFAERIDAGTQEFELEGFVRTFEETPPDVAQIVLEYRDAGNAAALDRFDSGQVSSVSEWRRIADVRAAPAGTRFLRLRLLATRFTEGDNDAYFDALALRPRRTATLAVDDVELYEGVVATGDSDSDDDEGGVGADDDGAPVLTDAVFTVRLACPFEHAVSVDYATADGTALAGEDYHAASGRLFFPAGATELEIAVPIVGDAVDEPHEVFHLDLLAVDSERVVVVDPRGDGRILNDDFCPRSPGFWKNHPEVWPVDYLVLGGVEHELPALLELLAAGGPDTADKLARQLVATKLNLAVGSDPSILPTAEEADAFLVDFPPGSAPTGAARQLANALKDRLDDYNDGDCDSDAGSDSGGDSDAGDSGSDSDSSDDDGGDASPRDGSAEDRRPREAADDARARSGSVEDRSPRDAGTDDRGDTAGDAARVESGRTTREGR